VSQSALLSPGECLVLLREKGETVRWDGPVLAALPPLRPRPGEATGHPRGPVAVLPERARPHVNPAGRAAELRRHTPPWLDTTEMKRLPITITDMTVSVMAIRRTGSA
jgi:hypothetical protein